MKQGTTLDELARTVAEQAQRRDDLLVDTRDLSMLNGAELSIPAEGTTGFGAQRFEYGISQIAHRQIGERLGIPVKFYDRLLLPDAKLDDENREALKRLLDTNVNTLFKQTPERRLVRTFKPEGVVPTVGAKLGVEGYEGTTAADGPGLVRAFLSDHYRRRDNDELLERVVPILGDLGAGAKVISCAVTDTRLYLKVVTEGLQGEVKPGEPVCAGVVIRNSEVGHGSLAIIPMIYTFVCTNGMTVGWETESAKRYAHLGPRIEADGSGRYSDATLKLDDEAFFAKVAEDVKRAVDETVFNDLLVRMQEAARGVKMADPVEGVERLTQRFSLSEGESHSVLRHLTEGADLSAWGALSAITRAAQDTESYERASELEAIGGEVLAMAGTAEWEKVAAV